jgi:CubicO group peptidase (beta-lactamase class C family)
MQSRRAFALGSFLLLFIATALAQDSSSGRFAQIQSFLSQELEFERYVFPPGKFPGVKWRDPASIEAAVGKVQLTAKFYDGAFNRAGHASKPGRYGAVVTGATADGFQVVRYVTLYCATADMDDYGSDVPLSVNPLKGFAIPKERWDAYADNIRKFSFGSLLTLPTRDPDVAIFLAGLSQLDSTRSRMETPRINDRQWWVEFKRRYAGRSPRPPIVLVIPRGREDAAEAPMLTEAAYPQQEKSEDGMPHYQRDLSGIRSVCAAWADSAREPLVALVAQRGKILFHEAFGRSADGEPMQTETPTWMASITKLLTGVLVMQCVDQALVDLDAPIDKYLDEFSSGGPSELTLRMLLTHTAGLGWSGEWASDWEPSIENRIAHVQAYLNVGETFKYHRSGYALAGKVLERITGQAVPYLFDRLLLKPLSMDHSTVDNTYGGLYATALDVARLGQMLLNRGRYGKVQFLSDETYQDMLPQPLPIRGSGEQHERSWGIGTSPLAGHGLSDSTYGHEAASGAILRIDPEREMVIVVGRNKTGPDYPQYQRFVDRFLRAASALSEPESPRE